MCIDQLEDLDPVTTNEDPLQHHGSLFSPLFPQHEPTLDLEQQWQDVLAVLGPQVQHRFMFIHHLYQSSSFFLI